VLPERERQVLLLQYFQGYSTAEVGQELGLKVGQVQVLQLRALRRVALLEQGFSHFERKRAKSKRGTHYKRLLREGSHSSYALLRIPLKTWDRRQRISPKS